MSGISDPDIHLYLFLLRLSLSIVSLFFVRQQRALVLRRRVFSKLDPVLFVLDAVCAAQPPIPERVWGEFDTPSVPASIGVALCTTIPLFAWIGRQEKRAPSAVVLSLFMLFQRVTVVALYYKMFPLQVANAAVAAKCVWTSLQSREQPILPRVV